MRFSSVPQSFCAGSVPLRLAGLFAFCLLPVLSPAQSVPVYTIKDVAGNGIGGYLGDSAPAINCQLWMPWGMVFDSSGNLFIADEENSVIRKIDQGGTITTFAGTTTRGFLGDAAAATAAELNFPSALVINASGTMFFSDSANNRIRAISSGGTISTIAGDGTAAYTGDGAAATAAELNTPIGLALDPAGNLYVADTLNHVIRMIAASGGNITTVAGTIDSGHFGDGGPATNARLNYPQGIAFAGGNLYIADTNNHRIRIVTPDGNINNFAGTGVGGFSGDEGAATDAMLFYPKNLAVDAAGNVFIADTANSRIRVITPDGIIHTIAGNGLIRNSNGGNPARNFALHFPGGLVLGSGGRVFVSDTQANIVRVLTPVPPAASTPDPAISDAPQQ